MKNKINEYTFQVTDNKLKFYKKDDFDRKKTKTSDRFFV